MDVFGQFGQLVWWQYVVIVLFLTHLTIMSVTLFLHRAMAHRAVIFSPIIAHFFRFWLWLTTGMITKEWVAVHRRHHAKCETEGDPHSPVIMGLSKILFLGALVYNQSAKDPETLKYVEDDKSFGLPNDWLEENLYKIRWLGITLFLAIEIYLFGIVGFVMWLVQMIWIPLWAAGVINGIGHYWGYRNADTPDNSTNIFPFGVFIGGEELHNNHHMYPTSAKFSQRKFEFDWGWQVIRFLNLIGLAEVKKAISLPVQLSTRWQYKYFPEKMTARDNDKEHLSEEELYNLISRHRFYVAMKFWKMFGREFFAFKAGEVRSRFYKFFYHQDSDKLEPASFNVLLRDAFAEGGKVGEFANFLTSLREAK